MFATKRCANISNCTYQYLLPLVFIVKYWYICMPVIIIICTFTVRLLASISDVGFMASNSYYPPLNHPLSQLFPLLATSMAVGLKGPVGKSQGEHLQHACECRVPAICRAGNLIKRPSRAKYTVGQLYLPMNIWFHFKTVREVENGGKHLEIATM